MAEAEELGNEPARKRARVGGDEVRAQRTRTLKCNIKRLERGESEDLVIGLPAGPLPFPREELFVPSNCTAPVWAVFRKHVTAPLAVVCSACDEWMLHKDGNTSSLINHIRACKSNKAREMFDAAKKASMTGRRLLLLLE